MAQKKNPRGRPCKANGEARTVALTVRMTPAEHAALATLATQEGRGLGPTLIVKTLGRRFA